MKEWWWYGPWGCGGGMVCGDVVVVWSVGMWWWYGP